MNALEMHDQRDYRSFGAVLLMHGSILKFFKFQLIFSISVTFDEMLTMKPCSFFKLGRDSGSVLLSSFLWQLSMGKLRQRAKGFFFAT